MPSTPLRSLAVGLALLVVAGCDCSTRVRDTQATLVVSPEFLDFGEVAPGDQKQLALELRNDSATTLRIGEVFISGEHAASFEVASAVPRELLATEVAKVAIRFTAPTTRDVLVRAVAVVVSDATNASRLAVPLLAATGGCVRKSCSSLGKVCGDWNDGCGGTVACGGCTDGVCSPGGSVCIPNCRPTTCTALGVTCGRALDGCGGMLDCGRCENFPEDAGAPDAGPVDAGCRPRTCQQANANCGSLNDGCGTALDCGACLSPSVCGGAGTPNQCGSTVPSGTVPAPPLTGLNSTCTLRFPPTAGIPCVVADRGSTYFVSAAGSDSNSGTSATSPWRTLSKAAVAAPVGSTVRVAAGLYLEAEITVARDLTFKGGFDPTFTTWAPDQHHSVIAGTLRLSHDGAVFGGFRLITRTNGHGAHFVTAGTLIRNYVEMVLEATPLGVVSGYWHTSYGLVAAAAAGHQVTIRCNDVYARAAPLPQVPTPMMFPIELGNVALHNGSTAIDSNRLCLDQMQGGFGYGGGLIDGYGSCQAGSRASVVVTNNVLEGLPAQTSGVDFYGCTDDLSVTVTNNTIVTTGPAVTGSPGGSGSGASRPIPVTWRLTNNVFAKPGPPSGSAISGGSAPNSITAAEGNLVFGWSTNAPSPTPLQQTSNDYGGASSLGAVFVNAGAGDFRPLTSGPASSGGVNVHGQAAAGGVTTDLLQRPRPTSGAWARGALLP